MELIKKIYELYFNETLSDDVIEPLGGADTLIAKMKDSIIIVV